MTEDRSTRRQFLRTSGVLGSLALAGCSSTFNEEVGSTPPKPETTGEVDQLGRVNVVTTFGARTIPDYWSTIGGPAASVEGVATRSFEGSTALKIALGSIDHQVLGITTKPKGMPLQDGDTFFAWVYTPTSGGQLRFGLNYSFKSGDTFISTVAPALEFDDGTVVGRTRDGDGNLTETTISTDFGPGQWMRLELTMYPSTNEVVFAVADDYGKRDQTDPQSIGSGFDGEYQIIVQGDQSTDATFFVDNVTAGPYREDATPTGPPSDENQSDDDGSENGGPQLTATGYPQITLNWAYYVDDLLSDDVWRDLNIADAEGAPQQALSLNAVSITRGGGAYYEEYQTPDGARQRLDVDEGEKASLYYIGNTTEVTARSSITVDGFPHDWRVFEDENDVYALTRAGNLVAGGYLPTDTYMDPRDTLIEQIRNREKPEAEGMASHPFDVLKRFETQYGYETLDLAGNTAASVSMDSLTKSRARSLVREWYPDDRYEELDVREIEFSGVPVDAYEGYEVTSDTFRKNFDCRVISWHSAERATQFAEQMLQQSDWTFDPIFPSDKLDDLSSSIGPYGKSSTNPPNCGLVTEDGVQKLRKVATAFDNENHVTHDVYSGTLTIVRV